MYDIVYVKLSENSTAYNALKQEYPHAILIDSYINLTDILKSIKQLCYTNMVWIVSDNWYAHDNELKVSRSNYNDLQIHYMLYDSNVLLPIDDIKHGTRDSIRTGAYCVPLNHTGLVEDISIITNNTTDQILLDIFFVSYNEPNADANWDLFVSRFPHARRVHGIKGIDNAHKHCARISRSGMFWTVDADTVVHNDFKFDYIPSVYNRKYLHIWHSLNPVNGLTYGWGSIKLWPTESVLNFDGNWLDFTTTVGNIHMMSDVVATSVFNTDTWSAWRSGFREAVKLCVNIKKNMDDESLQRLITWLSIANPVEFASDARTGANDGLAFFLSVDNIQQLRVINDFTKLQQLFHNRTQYNYEQLDTNHVLSLLNAKTLA